MNTNPRPSKPQCFSITLTTLLLLAAILSPSPNAAAQNPRSLMELGATYFAENQYKEALERFEAAHKLAPGSSAIIHSMALCHRALAAEAANNKLLPEALTHLDRAIELEPREAGPHLQAGNYLFADNKLEGAEFHLKTALALDPALLEARALLGEVHYRNNALKQARAQWKKVLEAKPDWPGLQERLDKLHREDRVEANFQEYASDHFQVRYGKSLSEETRARVFDILESAYQEIGRALGDAFPTDPIQVVLYEGAEFAEATQADPHVGALFDGKIRAPITNYKGRFLSTPILTSRLRHEYVHVVLREKLGTKVPWWLNEGLAETLSRDMDQNRLHLLRAAYRDGTTLLFAELESNPRQQHDPERVSVAYAQAHVAVDLLWQQSKDQFPAYLKALAAGTAPEEALKTALQLDYAGLNQRTEEACGPE